MTHFPIFKNSSFDLSSDEIISYIKAFPDHKISTKRETMRGISDFYFKTYHNFQSKLRFEVSWKSVVNIHPMTPFISYNEVMYFLEREDVFYIDCKMVSFSSDEYDLIPSKKEARKFFELLRSKIKPLLDSEYEILEYKVREKHTLPEEVFTNLIQEVSRFIAFEEYLKNRDKN